MWVARCLLDPYPGIFKSGLDMNYRRCNGEIESLSGLCHNGQAHQHLRDIQPSTDLATFDQLSDRIYCISVGVSWGEMARG